MDDNDSGRLLGLETELLLLDDRGDLSNRAREIVNHSGNTGNIVPEFCQAVVETNPPPSASIGELETNLHAELSAVHSIADSLGITEVPLSEIGPGNQAQRNLDSRRYVLFEEIMGAEHCNMERSFCGTHLHVDHKVDVVGQYNLLQSMDPVFVLMSSSSFVRGRNSANCGRVNSFRNEMFHGSPHLNQLLDYVATEDDLATLERARSDFFLSRLEPTEENGRIFGGYSNGSTPLRKTEHTIEIRCADSNLPTLAIAMAALYKGVLERTFEVSPLEILISPLDSEWHITGSEIVLPSYRTLKVMESEGIAIGINSQLVSCYLSYLLMVAEQGLPRDEVRYLQPFKEILQHKRNVADLIHAKTKLVDPTTTDTVSSQSAALVSLFLAEQYRDDLSGGSQLVDMIRHGVH
jgi:gamma-glutamylcysteine synthetase